MFSSFSRQAALFLAAVLPAALASAAPVGAGVQDGLALAQSKTCLGCHKVDNKVVGPSYQSVAQRYAGQPDALDHLTQSILQGSARRWGAIPMPAQKTAVSEAEARELARWILAQKP